MDNSILSKVFFVLIFLLGLHSLVFAQSFIPGNSYFSPDGNIEYIAGNLPIIMSVPHGGYLTPSALKDRNCTGCIYGRDLSTQEMARDIEQAVFNKSGCRIHVIINLLSRRKLDANREIIEAADADPLAEASWYAFQSFIDTARQELMKKYGKGFYIDLHGHGHILQRAELGYHFSGIQLRMSDSYLNSPAAIGISTIKNLVTNNPALLTHAELIRGQYSFGEFLNRAGYDAVPSMSDPAPLSSQSYFSGGYNVQQQGSANGGSIDAIQIETGSATRSPAVVRQIFADSLTSVFISYIKKHYFPASGSVFCSQTSIDESKKNTIRIRKLSDNNYQIEGIKYSQKYEILNSLLQQVHMGVISSGNSQVNLSNMDMGIYYLRLRDEKGFQVFKILIANKY